MACLYTHAKTRTELDWVYEMFEKDVKNACNGAPTHLQFSAYAIGIAMRENTKDETLRNKTVHGICKAIRTGNLQEQEVVSSLLALAYLCDQRSVENTFSSEVLEEVLEAIESIDREYAYVLSMNCEREKQLVTKVVQGTYLEDEEEAYLMTQIEKQMNA